MGTSVWVTSGNAYNYPGRDPLLLFEPNVNAWNTKSNDPREFEKGTIWFDVSGVDGINAHMEFKYGKVDRKIFVPLFETKTRSGNLMEEDEEELPIADIEFIN